MPAWRIYYGDGSTHEGDPWNAPGRDVQIICVADPVTEWRLVHQHNHYWYLPERDTWAGGDLFGLYDYLLTPGPKKVVFGRTMDRDEFNAIIDRANREWYKSAVWPDEQRAG